MPEPGRRQPEPVRRQDFSCYSNAKTWRVRGVFVFLVNLVDFKRFSLTCKGFKEKFYDILLKVCTKRFSESSSVTGNDERRPKDGKFPTPSGLYDTEKTSASKEVMSSMILLVCCGRTSEA